MRSSKTRLLSARTWLMCARRAVINDPAAKDSRATTQVLQRLSVMARDVIRRARHRSNYDGNAWADRSLAPPTGLKSDTAAQLNRARPGILRALQAADGPESRGTQAQIRDSVVGVVEE